MSVLSIPAQYQLTPKDLQSSGIDLVRLYVNTGGVAATDLNTAIYSVPGDKLLLCTQVSWVLTSGGAQRPLRFSVTEYLNAGGTIFAGYVVSDNDVETRSNTGVAADLLRWFKTVQVAYVAGPGTTLYAGASYSGGAAANVLECNLHGWLIPRGNVQLSGTR